MLILSQVDSLTAFHSKHSSFCFQNSMQTYTQLYKSLLPAWDRHCISPLAYTARTCLLVSAFLCVPPTCNIFHTEQAARKTLLNVSQIMASQSFHLSPHSALNKNQTLHRGSHSPPPPLHFPSSSVPSLYSLLTLGSNHTASFCLHHHPQCPLFPTKGELWFPCQARFPLVVSRTRALAITLR